MPTINRSNKVREPKQIYKHNRQSEKYYNTLQWKNLRNSYIKEHPFCQYCQEHYNRVRLAEEVHHCTEFLQATTEEGRMELLLDPNNLMSVCRECHMEIHSIRRKNRNNPGEDQQKVK